MIFFWVRGRTWGVFVLSELFGDYYVTPTGGACLRAWSICKGHVREYQRIRAHGLKLAFWPKGADLDWDWIKSLESENYGSMRPSPSKTTCESFFSRLARSYRETLCQGFGR